ncbi:methionyl-tRNA formyltransferase [Anaerosporomusa subterranea]|uniref:Methionyl-tRNA formyltransferase n=1 Tax=Anaerosporomusa subterranea TaxID=1794912 RepID=A0A154BTF3_ANASB|nr:methionyl-tRNA formyltransferase [Anaerosporomusa subterranea]KYZ77209.1 methionyl-tRNA formyltransferase [Anaerosporomusa subterranea]
MLRVVFMGTPDFAVPCLNAIVNAGHEVAAVVTQPDRPKGRGKKMCPSPIKQAALDYNLTVLQPGKIKDPAFLQELRLLSPDVIVVVAYGQILPKNMLDLPRLGCINVHASLLPRYRGAAPIHWAIINGDQTTGVTTMYMDVGMDTGDMILKKEIPIGPEDTTGILHDKLMIAGADLLLDTLALAEAGQAPRTSQDHAAATYAPLLTREVERIDWTLSAQEIHNRIRGLCPWPGAYCFHKEKSLKLCKSRVATVTSLAGTNKHPGRIHALTSDGVIVEAGVGAVELLELQPECRQRMNARDCANGYCLLIDETLI